MARLCKSSLGPRVYLAIGKGAFGFACTEKSVQHLWSSEEFSDDTRVIVEGKDGLLALSAGCGIHLLDPAAPRKPKFSAVGSHQDTIYSLHFDADTGIILSSGKDRCLKAWLLEDDSLSPLASQPEAHSDWVLGIQFNSETRTVVSAGIDGLIRIWGLEASSFSLVATSSEVHRDGILALKGNLKTGTLVSSGRDGALKVWNLQTGGLLGLASKEEAHEGWLRGIQFDPHSQILLTCGDDGALRVWKLSGAEFSMVVENSEAHRGGILGLQFCAKTGIVITAGDEGCLKIWRLDLTSSQLTELAIVEDAHNGGALSALQFDPESKLAMTAGSDNKLRAWRLEGQQLVPLVTARHPTGVLALQLDAEEGFSYTADLDGSISVWQIDVGGSSLTRAALVANAHKGRILAFYLDASSKVLLTAGVDKVICAWQLRNGELCLVGKTSQLTPNGVLALVYDSKSGIVLSTGMDGAINAWRHSGDLLKPLPLGAMSDKPQGGLLALRFDAPSKIVIGAGIDGSVKAWQLEVASCEAVGPPVQAHTGWSRALDYDTTAGSVASCGDDGHVRTFKLHGTALTPVGTAWNQHPDGARGVLTDGKEGIVLSCGDDGVIHAFRTQEGCLTPKATCVGAHDSVIFGCCIDAKQKLLISAGMEGHVKVWQMGPAFDQLELSATTSSSDRKPILNLQYCEITGVAFSSGIDGCLRAWKIEPDKITLLATTADGHQGPLRAMGMGEDSGKPVITGGEDSILCAWQFTEEKLVRVAHLEDAIEAGFIAARYHSPSGRVVTADDAGDLYLWQLDGDTFRKLFHLRQAHKSVINSLQFDAAAGLVFTGGATIRVWQLRGKSGYSAEIKLKKLAELEQPFVNASPLTFVFYDASSHTLVGSSLHGDVSSWTFEGGVFAPLATFEQAHARGAACLAVHHGSMMACTGGNDKVLRTWKIQKGGIEQICVATNSRTGKTFSACPKQR